MYRLELDGLRAIAVLAVIVNHANEDWLLGGYLGVDCFFVLSGYVVARSWALKDKLYTTATREFYKRRLRRLQPALILMVVGSTLLCWPNGLLTRDHVETAIASLIGLGNLSLLSQSLDYFGHAARNNPFTHTWSLGVEEQFYLLFPFLIKRKHWLNLLVLGGFILWVTLQIQRPEYAFYLMPARFWELGVGMLILKHSQHIPKRATINWIALGALFTCFTMPISLQLWATPITVMSSALLICSLEKPSKLKKFLSDKTLSNFGKHAYGLYLWHWPLLVISHTLWPSEVILNTLLPIFTTIAIAWASYRWIEQPLRNGSWGFKIGIPAIAASTGLILSTSLIANNNRSRISYDNFSMPHINDLQKQPCHSSSRSNALRECLNPNTNETEPIIVLIGDSHAAHLKPILASVNLPVKQLTDRNLPNIWLGRSCKEPSYCINNKQLLSRLETIVTPGSVIILGLSPRRLTGPNRSKKESDEAAKQLEKHLNSFIPVLERTNSQLLLIGGLPQINCIDEQSFKILFNIGGPSAVTNACTTKRKWAKEKNKHQLIIYEQFEEKNKEHVQNFDSLSIFCGQKDCHLSDSNGELLMWDNLAHLTPEGLRYLEGPLLKSIKKALSVNALVKP